MKETGIMFSTPMIQALPYKSQTRRTKGLELINEHPDQWEYLGYDEIFGKHYFRHTNGDKLAIKCPYGVKGGGLWCKETWAVDRLWDNKKPSEIYARVSVWYKTDARGAWVGKTRSAMFMPRWASRHLLELTEEPVPQRLQAISYEDILAEGWDVKTSEPWLGGTAGKDALAWYEALWDSLNGKKYSYSMNPWLWKLCFKEIEHGK